MKNFIILPYLVCVLGINYSVYSQELADISENIIYADTDRHSLYDYDEFELNSTDTIPDFQSKKNKLKITGVIYHSDGVTPAEGVILYIEQANEEGDFDLREHNNKRYPHHRGMVKTDANGRYTFYTFVPGNDRRYNQLQQVFPSIKEPSKSEYNLESFLFDEDPLLTRLCRKKISKKGDSSRILKPIKKNSFLFVEKNIVLKGNLVASK